MRKRSAYYCGKISPIVWLISAILILFFLAGYKVMPIVKETVRLQAKTIATQTINYAVQCALQECDTGYDRLAVINRNAQGGVTSVQTNMAKVNAIANLITAKIAEQTEEMSEQRIKIPLGTLVGSRLFTGRGPKVNFCVMSVGGAEANVYNNFESAGINQTLHQIVLESRIGVLGILPGYSIKTDVTSQICLAETIIIGTVPEYFTQIDGVDGEISGYISDYGPGKNGIP